MAGVLFKIRDDPRITKIGGNLRRWSLDELPQLIKRAARADVTGGTAARAAGRGRQVRDCVRRRLAVRPGLTGLWQIHGRSDLSWDEAVRLDLRYVENWSLAFDLLILWKTWPAVARGHGAY